MKSVLKMTRLCMYMIYRDYIDIRLHLYICTEHIF